jgi:hypothetical protein
MKLMRVFYELFVTNLENTELVIAFIIASQF